MSTDHSGGISHDDHDDHGLGDSLGYYAERAHAIELLLIAKGICTVKEIQKEIDERESRSPADGARVVARAWIDSEFKTLLLKEANAALLQLGYELPDTTPHLAVVENTVDVHYMIVCTLCSCYPRMLLGRPPDWYKSLEYRSRAVINPRSVMREFGLDLASKMEVRVVDSTADLRYLVLPRRPDGTGNLNEAELAKLVTRDSMIGVTEALSPEVLSKA